MRTTWNRWLGVLLVAATLVVAACGGKDGKEGGGEGAKAGGEGGGAPAGKALSDDKLLEIAKMDLPGGLKRSMGSDKVVMGSVNAFYGGDKNDKGVKPAAQVMVGKCNPNMCRELTKAVWEKDKDKLPHTMMFSKVVKEDPDLVHEIEETKVGDHKAIGAYVFAYNQTADGKGRSGTHKYVLYTHDGANFVMISAYGQGGSMSTEEEYKAQMSKDEMKKLATDAAQAILDKMK